MAAGCRSQDTPLTFAVWNRVPDELELSVSCMTPPDDFFPLQFWNRTSVETSTVAKAARRRCFKVIPLVNNVNFPEIQICNLGARVDRLLFGSLCRTRERSRVRGAT